MDLPTAALVIIVLNTILLGPFQKKNEMLGPGEHIIASTNIKWSSFVRYKHMHVCRCLF